MTFDNPIGPAVPEALPGDISSRPARTGVGRIVAGLLLVNVAIFTVTAGTAIVLLPARLAIIAPDGKVGILAGITATIAVVTFITTLTFGNLSDRTRSRLGSRNPWIIVAGAVAVIATVSLAFASSLPLLIAGVLVQNLAAGITAATIYPILPDRIPTKRFGVASTALGAGVLLGATLGVLLSVSMPDDRAGFLALAAVPIVLIPVFLLLAPDWSNKDAPPSRDRTSFLRALAFPRHAPDFYWAFTARLAVYVGYYALAGYQLYLLTDYLNVQTSAAKALIGTATIVNAVASLIGSVIAGPLSDLLGRRKIITIASSVIIAVAVLMPLLVPSQLGFLLYIGIGGFGLGMFLAVDGALMAQVLPSAASRGKDLGLLALPTNAGTLLGPLLAAAIIGSGAGYPPVFLLAAVLCVVGAGILIPIKSVR